MVLEEILLVRITVKFKNDVAVMGLDGQFVAGGDGPFLRQKIKDLMEAGTRRLVINFAGVPYIDSTGLGFLAGTRVTVQNAGASMVLASINPHVMKILDEVRLSQFFSIAKNEEAALEQINSVEPQASATSSGSEEPSSKEPKAKKRPRATAE